MFNAKVYTVGIPSSGVALEVIIKENNIIYVQFG